MKKIQKLRAQAGDFNVQIITVGQPSDGSFPAHNEVGFGTIEQRDIFEKALQLVRDGRVQDAENYFKQNGFITTLDDTESQTYHLTYILHFSDRSDDLKEATFDFESTPLVRQDFTEESLWRRVAEHEPELSRAVKASFTLLPNPYGGQAIYSTDDFSHEQLQPILQTHHQ